MKWNRSPSKKLLRIRVTSHESELEFNISPKSTGKYLFDLVCSTIGLRETWYFGLQSYSLLPNGRMRLSQWLKLDKKIVSQKSNAGQKQLCFYFHPKFFPEDIEQELIQATTRHLFYLSVKATILNRQETHVNGSTQGDLCPNVDVAILLASLAAQAEYGDLCEDDLDGKDDPNFLPNRLLRLIPRQLIPVIQSDQALAQKLRECYKSYKGINRDRAELQYLKVAQMHHLFGVDYFPIVCVRMKYPRTITLSRYLTRSQLTPWHVWDKHHTNAWLGVTAAGIQLYGRNRQEQPRYTFQWNIIKNVSYRERKFTIKLIANWRCCNKSSMTPSSITAGASAHPVTSMESGTVPQPVSQRPRQSNRSAIGRSPVLSSTGPLLLADVPLGSTACGSGASAASLPSTPLSVRQTLRPTASSSAGSAAAASGTTLASSRVAQESIYERAGPQITHSSTVTKTGRIFDFELGCVPSLTPISSRCSAGELPLLGAGSCLIAQHTSTNDSSGATSSTSSKSSFVHLHRPTTNSVVSVVEVWLADPTQAKTVMSMCAGNHALFMRRRQPDSVEVQQMRAQAREERARREIERSRLARARAEKAEALEAKWALESRCAQLEQALRRHQSLKLAYLSPEWLAPDGRRPMLRHLPDESETEPPMRKTYQHLNSSTAHMFSSNRSDDGVRLSFTAPGNDEDEPEQAENELSSIHRKVSTDNVDTEHSDIRFNESTFYPTEELSESKVLNSEDRLWNEMHPRRFPRHSSGFHDHSRGIPDRPYAGSSSTPATPHSKRDGSRHDPQSGVHPTHTPRAPPRSQSHQGHSHTRHIDPATSVAHSRLHCSACMYAKPQSFPGSDFFHACFPPVCDDGAPFHPPEPCPVCRHIPEHRHAMGFKTPYPRHFHPVIPGSLPALHQPYGVYDDAAWHPAVHPCGDPSCSGSTLQASGLVVFAKRIEISLRHAATMQPAAYEFIALSYFVSNRLPPLASLASKEGGSFC
ncbi:unnamed protein product [Dicrocoelium dendriticum]|nr:unnamed protein product [Dicrocoelium dendriticum]